MDAAPYPKGIDIKPCELLSPYIDCYWGTRDNDMVEASIPEEGILVIPDVCTDIILNINKSKNQISGILACIGDKPFIAKGDATSSIETIAVRFYSWTLGLFMDNDLSGIFNNTFNIDVHFNNMIRELESKLFDTTTMRERIEIIESYLIGKLQVNRQNNNVLNSIYRMMSNNCSMSVKDLCDDIVISKRKLERIFNQYVGTSPKKFCDMLRYQFLWRDIAFSDNNINDLVHKFGYYDQSHLISQFKKHHSLTPSQALKYAVKNS